MKTIVLIFAMILGVSIANAQTKTSIKVTDLPKAVTEDIATKHVGWKATEAFSINTNNVMSYDVVVEKGTSKMNLSYDKDGKFVKGEDVKTVAKPASKPATEQSTKPKM